MKQLQRGQERQGQRLSDFPNSKEPFISLSRPASRASEGPESSSSWASGRLHRHSRHRRWRRSHRPTSNRTSPVPRRPARSGAAGRLRIAGRWDPPETADLFGMGRFTSRLRRLRRMNVFVSFWFLLQVVNLDGDWSKNPLFTAKRSR